MSSGPRNSPTRLILASASPRRRDLIRRLGLPVSVQPARVAEEERPGETPGEHVVRLARAKAAAVAGSTPGTGVVVVGMDTIVVLDGRLLGKPASAAEAREMLRRLSGRTHEVLTGVALLGYGRDMTAAVTTAVRFKALAEREIDAYVATGEPLDKAGAYGIQGAAAPFIEEIRGCYYNVVGLPLNRLYEMLVELGLQPPLQGESGASTSSGTSSGHGSGAGGQGAG